MLNRILAAAVVGLVLVACTNETKAPEAEPEVVPQITHVCQHCDTAAVMRVAMQYDDPSPIELLQFFCALDESCRWENVPFRKTRANFQEISYELLILHLADRFEVVQQVFAENPNLNFDYFLKLIANSYSEDLPYQMIVDQYEALEQRSALQQRFLQTLRTVGP